MTTFAFRLKAPRATFALDIEAADEEEPRAFAAGDSVVVSRTAEIGLGKMLAGFVRAR
jgi:hypothetical protein